MMGGRRTIKIHIEEEEEDRGGTSETLLP